MVVWIPTSKDVYGAIFREHTTRLTVFSGFTRMEDHSPRMETEWGFRIADEPLIKSVATKKAVEQKEWDYEYFIALVKKD